MDLNETFLFADNLNKIINKIHIKINENILINIDVFTTNVDTKIKTKNSIGIIIKKPIYMKNVLYIGLASTLYILFIICS